MEEYKKWTDLTAEETKKIMDFRPPKYYRGFYKFYRRYLSTVICCTILLIGILGIIYNESRYDFWDLLLGGFFFVMGLGLWALSAHLIKHFYTKKFAKEMGLTLENWNYLTNGMSWWED